MDGIKKKSRKDKKQYVYTVIWTTMDESADTAVIGAYRRKEDAFKCVEECKIEFVQDCIKLGYEETFEISKDASVEEKFVEFNGGEEGYGEKIIDLEITKTRLY